MANAACEAAPRREGIPTAALPIGDGRAVRLVAYTCPACGGRGCSYDSEGNYIKCPRCGGSGQIND